MRPKGKYSRIWRLGGLPVCFLLLGALVAGQTGRERLSIGDIKQIPGEVVAEGETAAPETPMKIRGYQVERVSLPRPQNVRLDGRRTTVEQAWRITVHFNEPLTVRSQAFSLVIDGRWCGFLQESADLKSADAICFNRELVREGAAIGVTYRGVTIEQPSATDPVVDPLVEFEPDGEAIHYSSRKLHLKGR